MHKWLFLPNLNKKHATIKMILNDADKEFKTQQLVKR